MVYTSPGEYAQNDEYKGTFVGIEPEFMYLLMMLSNSIKKGMMIKSCCDENGNVLQGFGFVYLLVKTPMGERFYKYVVPAEYMSRINCLKDAPFFDDVLSAFDEVQKITHCSTGCGGCHDKIMDAISEIMMA